MLMAEENSGSSLNFWQTDEIDEDFGGGDGADDVWIDFDALNRILDEEVVVVDQWEEKKPMMISNTQEDLSCSNIYQGGKDPPEFNQRTELASQNGVNESEDVLPREDGLPETSEQCHSENMAPSDYREAMGSDEMFEFPETCDWPTMSCFEHDNGITKEGEAGAMNVPLHSYSYSTPSFLPVPLPTSSSTFDFASKDPSGQTNIMNSIYMMNEKSNNLGPIESSDPECASHPTSLEESDLTLSIGNHRAVREKITETPGLEQTHAPTSELIFIDVNMPFPNPHPTENMDNLASCIYYEDDISYTNQSSCERSSTITDASNFTDPKKFMPQFGLPFLENREEKMTCRNGRVKIEAEALSIERNASGIDFSNISDCLCTSPKYEASSHCSSGTSRDADGCSSSDSSWKLMPGSQVFMPIKKDKVKTEIDQGGKPCPSKCGSYQSLKAVDGYCSSLGVNPSGIEAWRFADQAQNQLNTDAQSLTSTKKLEVFVKDERKNEHILKRNTDYRSVQLNGVVQVNKSVYKSTIDDEADVCILEDISDPIIVPVGRVHGESLITSQRPGSDPQYPLGMGGARLKSFDERITFRAALQDIYQPKSESTPPEGSLAVPLLRHQRIALAWMVQKETASLHCSGGILADDQGLGKTISTIALILTEKPSCSKVTPVSAEQTEAKAFNLEDDDDGGVLQLNGVKRDPDCGQDITRKGSIKNETVMKGRPAAGTLVVCPTSVLRQWADELQNKVSKELKLSVLVYHGSNRTKDPVELAKYDVVLTTYSIVSMEVPKQPLVDKEDDDKHQMGGHSLSMEFSCSKKRKYPPSADKKSRKNKKGVDGALLESVARPLARVGWFRVVLDEAQSIKNHRTQVARACWGLRAKRRWCLSGTPVQNAIDDLYSYFRFLRYEPYAVYKSFVSMIKLPISRNPATGYKKLQAVLRTIMLRRTKGTFLDGEPIINLPPKSVELKRVEFSMEERDFYSKLEADSRAQFKVYAEAGTVKQNYVNILLMLLRLRQACDHPLLVRGYDSNSVWKSSMETAKKLAREKQVTLLNCLEACSEICCICNDPPEDAVVTICGHIFCNQCILEYLTGDENVCPASECKVHLTITSVFSRGTLRGSLSDAFDPIEKEPSCSEQGPSDSSKIRTALKVLESLPPKLVDSKEVSNVKAVTEKAIVFSQWTRMLDLLEAQLKTSCIQYRRLDGTMSVLARDKAVKDFNTLPEVTVMIMSLKAASLGLNMVAACHVILLDLWWNPTTEDQAIDRAHRIGQTRPVTVLRLTVKDTVEDRILALQQKKREMVASAFGEDETGTSKTRLTVDDLKYLFMA